MNKFLCLVSILLLFFTQSKGQDFNDFNRDSVKNILKHIPSFNIYRDNYFITGTSIDEKPSKNTSDIKFQISFVQRLTNAVLPFNSYLLLTYTQKSFWDVYKKSSPFDEINFNPGIGIGKLLFKGPKLTGILVVQLEHESNGKDSIDSRSWNSISATLKTSLKENVKLTLKGWIPYWYSDNPDLFKYIGYGEARVTWIVRKERLLVDVLGRKGASFDFKGSLQTQLCFKPFKNENQFIVLQWYQGYAESLIDYNKSVSILRIGILIKPYNFSYY